MVFFFVVHLLITCVTRLGLKSHTFSVVSLVHGSGAWRLKSRLYKPSAWRSLPPCRRWSLTCQHCAVERERETWNRLWRGSRRLKERTFRTGCFRLEMAVQATNLTGYKYLQWAETHVESIDNENELTSTRRSTTTCWPSGQEEKLLIWSAKLRSWTMAKLGGACTSGSEVGPLANECI